MKYSNYIILLLFLTLVNCSKSQEPFPINTDTTPINEGQKLFTLQIEGFTINNAPSIQSYSLGKTSDGKWLILGGRIDGLHKRRPFEAFLKKENNTSIFVIDPITNKTWETNLNVLPTSIFEQLQSTNQEFKQRGNTLYIIGGYGFSETEQNHITYPNLTAINVEGLAKAIIDGGDISSFFRQISNSNLAVTGGQLGLLNDTFYLSGGQYFKGIYNPTGPNNGSGFTQEYTNEIKKFKIYDDGTDLSINNYSASKDPQNLHRRDYNMVAQIFPDGTKGFTMFSGVFQYNANIPWLNTVDVTESGYKVKDDFHQLLSQYHSAKVPIFNSQTTEMMTIFFGGLSQFHFDAVGNLVRDDEIPFVKTISMVVRQKDGSMLESDLGIKMPAFLGSGAEFIPLSDETIYLENDILNLNVLKQEKTLIGYIFGGIESSQENIFFNNNGTQSSASNRAFKVFITRN